MWAGASQVWGGTGQVGRSWRRWAGLFAVHSSGNWQAQGLLLQWRRGGANCSSRWPVVSGQWLETACGGGGTVGETCCRGRMNRVGSRWGALRGDSPRTREGRRPDRSTAVVSGQWSVAENGVWGWRHGWRDMLPGKNEQGGEPKGGVAGGFPPHKGGPKARPLNCSG